MLDVDGRCRRLPKATIVVYFGAFHRTWLEYTILDAAMQDKPHNPWVLSMQLGLCEDAIDLDAAGDGPGQRAMTTEAAMLVPGSSVVAAGDDGSSDAINDGHAMPIFRLQPLCAGRRRDDDPRQGQRTARPSAGHKRATACSSRQRR